MPLLTFTHTHTHRTSTDRYANVDVGILLYHIERFPGIIVLTTNLIDNLDKAFFRRLKFVLAFDIPPFKLRSKIWRVRVTNMQHLEMTTQQNIYNLVEICQKVTCNFAQKGGGVE